HTTHTTTHTTHTTTAHYTHYTHHYCTLHTHHYCTLHTTTAHTHTHTHTHTPSLLLSKVSGTDWREPFAAMGPSARGPGFADDDSYGTKNNRKVMLMFTTLSSSCISV